MIRDDAAVWIVRLELEAGHVEWVVFNPHEKEIDMASGKFHAPYGYVKEKGPAQ